MRGSPLLANICIRCSISVLMCAFISPAIAGERTLIVPNRILHPRASIQEEDLGRRIFLYDPDGPSAYAEHDEDVVGFASRTTLLPNKPIPLSSLERVRSVITGARVTIVYEYEGISINVTGTALQNGAVGDRIRVRNNESGLALEGLVGQTGDIRIDAR